MSPMGLASPARLGFVPPALKPIHRKHTTLSPAPTPKPVIVIGGPTASGKSALALDLAKALNGVVINGDSMQLYAELSIVTARPREDETEGVPHRLYGVMSAAEKGTAAKWRAMALAEIAAAHEAGHVPVVVGGTGLYLRALMNGLADIPPIPDAIRQAARIDYTSMGGEAFRARLVAVDPASEKLHAGDVTRLTRAWEVWAATGRALTDWQATAADGVPAGMSFHPIVIDPPRRDLYASCDGRFRRMVEMGALEEVRRVAAMNLDPALPAMKALGVPELIGHLNEVFTLDQAIDKAQQATRNYAKRQVTWFRHQLVGKSAGQPLASGSHACHTISSLYKTEEHEAFISRLVTELRG